MPRERFRLLVLGDQAFLGVFADRHQEPVSPLRVAVYTSVEVEQSFVSKTAKNKQEAVQGLVEDGGRDSCGEASSEDG